MGKKKRHLNPVTKRWEKEVPREYDEQGSDSSDNSSEHSSDENREARIAKAQERMKHFQPQKEFVPCDWDFLRQSPEAGKSTSGKRCPSDERPARQMDAQSCGGPSAASGLSADRSAVASGSRQVDAQSCGGPQSVSSQAGYSGGARPKSSRLQHLPVPQKTFAPNVNLSTRKGETKREKKMTNFVKSFPERSTFKSEVLEPINRRRPDLGQLMYKPDDEVADEAFFKKGKTGQMLCEDYKHPLEKCYWNLLKPNNTIYDVRPPMSVYNLMKTNKDLIEKRIVTSIYSLIELSANDLKAAANQLNVRITEQQTFNLVGLKVYNVFGQNFRQAADALVSRALALSEKSDYRNKTYAFRSLGYSVSEVLNDNHCRLCFSNRHEMRHCKTCTYCLGIEKHALTEPCKLTQVQFHKPATGSNIRSHAHPSEVDRKTREHIRSRAKLLQMRNLSQVKDGHWWEWPQDDGIWYNKLPFINWPHYVNQTNNKLRFAMDVETVDAAVDADERSVPVASQVMVIGNYGSVIQQQIRLYLTVNWGALLAGLRGELGATTIGEIVNGFSPEEARLLILQALQNQIVYMVNADADFGYIGITQIMLQNYNIRILDFQRIFTLKHQNEEVKIGLKDLVLFFLGIKIQEYKDEQSNLEAKRVSRPAHSIYEDTHFTLKLGEAVEAAFEVGELPSPIYIRDWIAQRKDQHGKIRPGQISPGWQYAKLIRMTSDVVQPRVDKFPKVQASLLATGSPNDKYKFLYLLKGRKGSVLDFANALKSRKTLKAEVDEMSKEYVLSKDALRKLVEPHCPWWFWGKTIP